MDWNRSFQFQNPTAIITYSIPDLLWYLCSVLLPKNVFKSSAHQLTLSWTKYVIFWTKYVIKCCPCRGDTLAHSEFLSWHSSAWMFCLLNFISLTSYYCFLLFYNPSISSSSPRTFQKLSVNRIPTNSHSDLLHVAFSYFSVSLSM